MRIISITENYRADSEEEAKQFIEEQKDKAAEDGYILKSYSSTHKEKKSKGEIVDEGYDVRIVKTYGTFWD